MVSLYIIIAYNSEGAISVVKKMGTREEIQEYVLKTIVEDREKDEENWDMGTESIRELEYDGESNGLRGYNNFVDYSINYVAYPISGIQEVY